MKRSGAEEPAGGDSLDLILVAWPRRKCPWKVARQSKNSVREEDRHALTAKLRREVRGGTSSDGSIARRSELIKPRVVEN